MHLVFAAAAAAVAAGGSAGGLPVPTADQLMYQRMGVGGMISFNMATAVASEGCTAPGVYPPASAFGGVPKEAATDQWCEAVASFGGRYVIMVAKHECGFALWPTKAASGGFVYNYSVPEGVDYVQQVAESCAAVGVKMGLYYSTNRNSYASVWDNAASGAVTLAQYKDVVLQQLAELWGNYGDLAEIWFDGGVGLGADFAAEMAALKEKLQPRAVAFNGCGVVNNSVAWIGTESGHGPYPLWNTQDACGTAPGDPDATTLYLPFEADVTLETADTWFYKEAAGYKSFPELVSIYHATVGVGANLLLNLAPPPSTVLPDAAMQLYAELGGWVRRCYGGGGAAAAGALNATRAACRNCTAVALELPAGAAVDRFQIQEELAGGQRIRQFSIAADGAVVYRGTSVGATHVALLGRNVTAARVELRVEATRGGPAAVALFAAPDPADCAVAAPSTNCTTVSDVRYTGPAYKAASVANVPACCEACRADTACAAFTAVQGAQWPYAFSCSLMTAMTGSESAAGVYSGAPRR